MLYWIEEKRMVVNGSCASLSSLRESMVGKTYSLRRTAELLGRIQAWVGFSRSPSNLGL